MLVSSNSLSLREICIPVLRSGNKFSEKACNSLHDILLLKLFSHDVRKRFTKKEDGRRCSCDPILSRI